MLVGGCTDFVAAEQAGTATGGSADVTMDTSSGGGDSSSPTSGTSSADGGSGPAPTSTGSMTSGPDEGDSSAGVADEGGGDSSTGGGMTDPGTTSSAEGGESSESSGEREEPVTCATLELPEVPATVCSESAVDNAEVSFLNDCESQTVSVYWVNYNCDEIYYFDVPAGDTRTLYTFTTHPWRIRDSVTGTLLAEIEVDDAGPSSASVLDE